MVKSELNSKSLVFSSDPQSLTREGRPKAKAKRNGGVLGKRQNFGKKFLLQVKIFCITCIEENPVYSIRASCLQLKEPISKKTLTVAIVSTFFKLSDLVDLSDLLTFSFL